MANAKYNCSQAELYTILNLGWLSCLTYISGFTAFSAAYNPALISARQAAILAAQALPDFQARNAIAEILRNDLSAQNTVVLGLFQQLKRYITHAFAVVDQQANYDAAGQGYYAAAAGSDWDATAQMLSSMTVYIAANSVALLASANMPVTFAAAVTSAKSTFDTIQVDFLQARQDAFIATETKINANNQCYQDLTAMFADAQVLGFPVSVLKQFTFISLLQLISGTGSSGVQGTITVLTSGLPLGGATVSLTNLGVSYTTLADGLYSFPTIPSGTYDVEISAIGYTTILDTITLTTGVTSTNDYALTV